MAQELLHASDVGSPLQEVRGERVPESMRCHAPIRHRPLPVPLDHGPDVPGGHGLAAPIEEQRRRALRSHHRPAVGQVVPHRVDGEFGQGKIPFLGTLPHHGDPAPGRVHALHGEAAHLAHPQARAVEELEDSAVAQDHGPFDLGELLGLPVGDGRLGQRGRLGGPEHRGKAGGHLRPAQAGGRVRPEPSAGLRPPVERPDRGHPARHGRPGVAAGRLLGHEPAERLVRGLGQGDVGAGLEDCEGLDVTPVRGDGVRRQAPLVLEVVHEGLDELGVGCCNLVWVGRGHWRDSIVGGREVSYHMGSPSPRNGPGTASIRG